MHPHRITCKVADLVRILGWDEADDITVEVGGTAVSGLQNAEGANPKWTRPFGTVHYNKDAFIVIKNRDRTPFEPSRPPDEVQSDD